VGLSTSLLINIDNGGTLTDFCVVDGDRVHRTKTLTTPYDLSKCLFDGLAKVSRLLYGEEDLRRLMLATSHIRYSTTQGTNALVERKGPRLGLVLINISREVMRGEKRAAILFDSLIGERCVTLDAGLDGGLLEVAATQAVNALASAGADRIVVGAGGEQAGEEERRLAKILLRRFPPHLLGALPMLYSHHLLDDDVHSRRIWTAIFNAFLHPPMERLLYGAEQRLRYYKTRKPLLIFRNDGAASRIALTSAVKTYSSGPRGGAEAARALATHYGLDRLVGIDVGGTTSDLCLVQSGVVDSRPYGQIDGVTLSLALPKVESFGVGGSSVIRVIDGAVRVGPDSVGGAPGPACFGLGGTLATITDAFLASGLLEPTSFFGGELPIDVDRARAAIVANVGTPLLLSQDAAVSAMEDAWVGKVVEAIKQYAPMTPDTALAAYGGAGPLVICRIAEVLGIRRVLIPALAAVFSAFGVGFSDISHEFELRLETPDEIGKRRARVELGERVRRAMFSEGFALEDCRVEERLRYTEAGEPVALILKAAMAVPQAVLRGEFGAAQGQACAAGIRRTWVNGQWQDLPLYCTEELGGTRGEGPAVLEEAFYTCRIAAGWRFECNASGDILLTR
jgi:N-methylhydantoinase A